VQAVDKIDRIISLLEQQIAMLKWLKLSILREKFPENRFELTAIERQLRIPIDSCRAVKQAMKAWREENGKADGS
jgi:hypothetical protein